MNIVDFFNERNPKHLKAYRELKNTGCWPKNFIPKNTEFPTGWHFIIMSKMVDAYLDDDLFEEI